MYDTVLVPTDGGEAAADALAHARAQALAHDARLVVLSVVETAGPVVTEEQAAGAGERGERYDERRAHLEAVVDDLRAAGVDAEWVVETGVPAEAIPAAARDHGADLVVMATHGRTGVDRFLHGSVTEQVLRDGDVPVLAVQQSGAD